MYACHYVYVICICICLCPPSSGNWSSQLPHSSNAASLPSGRVLRKMLETSMHMALLASLGYTARFRIKTPVRKKPPGTGGFNRPSPWPLEVKWGCACFMCHLVLMGACF